MIRSNIWLVERNVHGAWVIYGALGVRQYYYYSKAEAQKRYNDECAAILFFNQ